MLQRDLRVGHLARFGLAAELDANNYAAKSAAGSSMTKMIATGNATQSLGGRVIFQTPGAKDAPSTGAAGDLAVTTSVVSAFNFNAGAVDSDAANRIFLASWTMSASDAAHEIRVEGSTVELM